MLIDSIATLLAVLRRTQLLADEQVEEVARELAPHYDDPVALAEYLTEVEWLTPYQLELLLAGRWDELTLGPYNILDRLGAGGLSEVFKAWDTMSGRVVALKVLHQHLADRSDIVRQFRKELEAITRLSHPNIIKTYHAHQDGAMHYFAMEFIEGKDLEKLVREGGPLPIDRACDYARQTAMGLQYAHQSGLVHRDIKPANLFLVSPRGLSCPGKRPQEPVVKILDWGLARCLREPEESSRPPSTSSLELDAEKGSLIGTADYIAPEQAQDPRLVDTRADLYSLGCTLFFLLTGRPPFEGSSLIQKLLRHKDDEPPLLRQLRPDAPPELEELVRKMLYKKVENRPQIPLLVATALRRFSAGGAGGGNGNGSASWSRLPEVGGAPKTSVSLARPTTHGALPPSAAGTEQRPAH